MENKQTAVDWLWDILTTSFWDYKTFEEQKEIIEIAKAMEREQIVEAHLYGLLRPLVEKPVIQAEEFYNEIYKTPKP